MPLLLARSIFLDKESLMRAGVCSFDEVTGNEHGIGNHFADHHALARMGWSRSTSSEAETSFSDTGTSTVWLWR